METAEKSIPLDRIMRLSDVATRMGWGWRTLRKLKRAGLSRLTVVINSADHVNTSELWAFLREMQSGD